MVDLTTSYMGIRLKNPLVPSASPLSQKLDSIKEMEKAGAAAVVMFSLFEEQIAWESQALDYFLNYGSEHYAEALSHAPGSPVYLPDLATYHMGAEPYLDLIRRAKQAVDIPIIGSLNGGYTGAWVEHAEKIQEAGADALELNIYFLPTDMDMTGAQIEQRYVDLVCTVKKHISIPLAVKVGPFFSAMGSMAQRLAEAGADALVLFNRFYQSD